MVSCNVSTSSELSGASDSAVHSDRVDHQVRCRDRHSSLAQDRQAKRHSEQPRCDVRVESEKTKKIAIFVYDEDHWTLRLGY
jgi:hypothetical protein